MRTIAFCLLLACAAPAHATTFGVHFDGTTASVDQFMDPIQDASVGPAFTLFVRAAPGDYWSVVAPIQPGTGGLLSLYTTGAGVTGGQLSFLRNDVVVASGNTVGGALVANHVSDGLWDNVAVLVGMAFDLVRLDHPGGGSGSLQLTPDVFHPAAFFRWGQFQYNQAASLEVAQTPLPPALILFGSALVGLGLLGKRKAARTAAAA